MATLLPKISFYIKPSEPIRPRDPSISVLLVDTVPGLEYPHIIRCTYKDETGFRSIKYTVDKAGYRYHSGRPSRFDIENSTRPNSFADDAMPQAEPSAPRVPVPSAGEETEDDAPQDG